MAWPCQHCAGPWCWVARSARSGELFCSCREELVLEWVPQEEDGSEGTPHASEASVEDFLWMRIGASENLKQASLKACQNSLSRKPLFLYIVAASGAVAARVLTVPLTPPNLLTKPA